MRSLSASDSVMFSPCVPSRSVVSYRTTACVAHAGTSAGRAKPLDHGGREAGRADDHEPVGRVGFARKIRRSPACVERRMDGAFDRRGDVRPSERPAGKHRRRQDRADRVRAVLAREMRSGAVDRLVHPEPAVLRPPLAERRRRQQPERSGKDARLVRQDVAEQVLGHEHVELGGSLDEEHRARVDELVVELDVREVRGDLGGNAPPESRRREDIRLVDAGDATAPGPGELERKPDDPGDLVLRSTGGCRWPNARRRSRPPPGAPRSRARP